MLCRAAMPESRRSSTSQIMDIACHLSVIFFFYYLEANSFLEYPVESLKSERQHLVSTGLFGFYHQLRGFNYPILFRSIMIIDLPALTPANLGWKGTIGSRAIITSVRLPRCENILAAASSVWYNLPRPIEDCWRLRTCSVASSFEKAVGFIPSQ